MEILFMALVALGLLAVWVGSFVVLDKIFLRNNKSEETSVDVRMSDFVRTKNGIYGIVTQVEIPEYPEAVQACWEHGTTTLVFRSELTVINLVIC